MELVEELVMMNGTGVKFVYLRIHWISGFRVIYMRMLIPG